MRTSKDIPQGKVMRASKMIAASLKVGKNYAAYYGKKAILADPSKEELDASNGAAIMDTLQQLKGGGLKAAQMLSMDKNLLPKAFADQLAKAQYSVPPLSAPLIKKTFRKHFGSHPEDVFDSFSYECQHAASIGQVHEAYLGDQKLAVKIQYPGVADSIESDLNMLRPLGSSMLRLQKEELDYYFDEVKGKLLEETDYEIELANSVSFSSDCAKLEGIVFPEYLPQYSNKKILTMEWIDGVHLKEWIEQDPSQKERDRIGQTLWDFYMFQIHELKKLHADPHPGNFLISEDGKLGVLDFGCTKEIPLEFYTPYVRLQDPTVLEDDELLADIFLQLDILREDDEQEQRQHYFDMFKELLTLALSPYTGERFDFGAPDLFQKMTALGDKMSRQSLTSKYKPNRGSKHFIFSNRTFFGLYQLLHMMEARVVMQ